MLQFKTLVPEPTRGVDFPPWPWLGVNRDFLQLEDSNWASRSAHREHRPRKNGFLFPELGKSSAQTYVGYTPHVDLQQAFTEPLHRMVFDEVLRGSGADQLDLLNSLTTPHATAWTTSNALTCPLNAEEFRCGLKWIMGIPFRHTSYRCPDCGRAADEYGVHAVTCLRSGAIGRCHTLLRDTLGTLLLQAGIPAVWEPRLPPGSATSTEQAGDQAIYVSPGVAKHSQWTAHSLPQCANRRRAVRVP